MLDESTDTTSFSSILLGVKRLRDETDNNNITERFNQSRASNDQTVERVASAIQRPFTEGQRITPNNNSNQLPALRERTTPLANVYKKPVLNLNRVNNNARRTTFSNIQVSVSQKGNPLISSLKIPYEYNEKLRNCDYLINSTTFILFLSLKYHKLHPEYIYNRIKKFNGPNGLTAINNNLKMLLCLVDVENNDEILKELNKICLLNDLSLILAWSFDECASYINYLKQLENSNTHSLIKGQTNEDDYFQTLTNTLTSIKQINKTDTVNLITKYGSFQNLVNLSNEDDLSEIQGMGKVKISKFLANMQQSFIINKNYPEKVKDTVKSVSPAPALAIDNDEDDFDDFELFLKEVS